MGFEGIFSIQCLCSVKVYHFTSTLCVPHPKVFYFLCLPKGNKYQTELFLVQPLNDPRKGRIQINLKARGILVKQGGTRKKDSLWNFTVIPEQTNRPCILTIFPKEISFFYIEQLLSASLYSQHVDFIISFNKKNTLKSQGIILIFFYAKIQVQQTNEISKVIQMTQVETEILPGINLILKMILFPPCHTALQALESQNFFWSQFEQLWDFG